jgi:hypothetical protein
VLTQRSEIGQVDLSACSAQEVWRKHKLLFDRIPRSKRWRGCIGLGMFLTNAVSGIPTKSGRFLVPDRDVRWVSLVDVPGNSFRISRPPEVHWAAVHRTAIRFGIPTITGKTEMALNLRVAPGDLIQGKGLPLGCNPGQSENTGQPDLLQVLNTVNWSMTSTAFACRPGWQVQRHHFHAAFGKNTPEITAVSAWGESPDGTVAAPATWMPRAYVAFSNRHCDRVFDRATKSGLSSGIMCYPNAIKQQFCADLGQSMPVCVPFSGIFVGAFRSIFHGLPTLDLVFKSADGNRRVVKVCQHAKVLAQPSHTVKDGDTIATEGLVLPAMWHHLFAFEQWRQVLLTLVRRAHLDAWLRLWFERQFVRIDESYIHLRSDLAATAAGGHAVDNRLYWDLTPAMPYYNESLDAFVFPTISIKKWWSISGVLPGEVLYDFAPLHARFIPHVASPRPSVSQSNELQNV